MLGLARIPLSCLAFLDDVAEGRRDEDGENIQRLLRIFKLEGCDRAEERHFIKGYVEQNSLSQLAAEKPKDFSNEDPASIPLINQLQVNCAEGLHRIRAAEIFLKDEEKWWVVKLYNQNGEQSLHSTGEHSLTDCRCAQAGASQRSPNVYE
jgi:hypothetical protein